MSAVSAGRLRSLTARDRLGRAAMLAVNATSRHLGRGQGTVVGGRVALAIAPGLLARLAAGRTVVLVSGTNGKTTTTACVAAALRTLGDVASNATGSNMLEGHTAALGADLAAPFAVLECDEGWLPRALSTVRPAAVVLLNLSRDQLDRTSEVRQVAERWRGALEGFAGVCVANADDPLVVHAASAAGRPQYYAGGSPWIADAATCPSCGRHLVLTGEWRCECGAHRPDPSAVPLDGAVLLDGTEVPLRPSLPGAFNVANTTAALLCAVRLGVPPAQAAAAIGAVDEVAGRFSAVAVDGRAARLLLAKNPAGWQALLDLVATDAAPVVLAVNARIADGRDPSWLYDVDFERLRGRRVTVAGERWRDLATRLYYGEVPYEVEPDPRRAVASSSEPGGRVEVIANYTAFADLYAALR